MACRKLPEDGMTSRLYIYDRQLLYDEKPLGAFRISFVDRLAPVVQYSKPNEKPSQWLTILQVIFPSSEIGLYTQIYPVIKLQLGIVESSLP